MQVLDTRLGTLTGADGTFRLGPLAPGSYEVRASALGYREIIDRAELVAGGTAEVRFTLEPQPVELTGVNVSVLRPDMRPETELREREVREANPRDVGELLRSLPGLDAVRRGPLGLDPVVRGLRETEVGVYLDGTRQFPAGPARMDSPLTHLDPSALQNIEVVKGPYALTWGAGNMSAVRVETQPLPPAAPGALHGRALTGYDTNLNAVETAASLFGSQERLSYWLHGAWREGDDYESGAGTLIPANFLSREIRGKMGLKLAPGSQISVAAGFQDQQDIDYPGRLLNANFFEATNLAARWSLERPGGVLRSAEALAYVNQVDHGMDNDGKPTAEPMEGRMPPFPLLVTVDARVDVEGGRLAATLAPVDAWEVEVGGDVYSATRDALRQISRRDTGMPLFEDFMWPDATITDAGAFVRLSRVARGPISFSATARLDRVWADADTASEFFRENVPGDPSARETNWSGAVTAGFRPNQQWSVSAGLGSAVRTADASERYGDRIPASKAQTSAEFVGTPGLDPERSTQADLWLQATYPRFTLSVNGFARRIHDYITIEPTDLPKRLPLSPPTVFRYINGEAVFWGAEATAAYALVPPLTLALGASYLWGEDETLDEPVLGISPPRGTARLRYQPLEQSFFVEGTLHTVAEQDRVAISRGEIPTGGYTTLNVQGGIGLPRGAMLRIGVTNLTDEQYVNHLNAKNPFTGIQIPEPGRVFFARLSYAF